MSSGGSFINRLALRQIRKRWVHFARETIITLKSVILTFYPRDWQLCAWNVKQMISGGSFVIRAALRQTRKGWMHYGQSSYVDITN